MSATEHPSDQDIQTFLNGLKDYRTTLPEKSQHLLDAMVAAAIGKKPETDEDTKPFWYAYYPGYTYAGGYAGWAATPWGYSYGYRYW